MATAFIFSISGAVSIAGAVAGEVELSNRTWASKQSDVSGGFMNECGLQSLATSRPFTTYISKIAAGLVSLALDLTTVVSSSSSQPFSESTEMGEGASEQASFGDDWSWCAC